jgi:hypothetical protein
MRRQLTTEKRCRCSLVYLFQRISRGKESFGYDLNGNLKANGSQSLDYNAFNKPVRIQEGTAGPETLFSYGANALRYRQINPAGATVYYIDKLMKNGAGVHLLTC